MRLIIEPTEHFFMQDDVMVRLWQGCDIHGQPFIALVTAICAVGDHTAAVPEGLVSIPPPDPAAAQRWAQHIIERKGAP